MRTSPPLGLYSGTMPMVALAGGAVSYEQGTSVGFECFPMVALRGYADSYERGTSVG